MRSIRTGLMDQETLDYLASVAASKGTVSNGVFIPRLWLGPRSRRPAEAVSLLVGLAAVCGALSGYWLCEPRELHLHLAGKWQALALAIGTGLVVSAVWGLSKPAFRARFGAFYWADARHLWAVTPRSVRFLDVDAMKDVKLTEHHLNGRYQYSTVELRMADGNEGIRVNQRAAAERLGTFLRALILLRPGENSQPLTPEQHPQVLGAVAAWVLEKGVSGLRDGIPLAELNPGLPLPQPAIRTPPPESAVSPTQRILPWAVAILVAVVGGLLFPALNADLFERRLFAEAVQAPEGFERPFTEYRLIFPNGRFGDQVSKRYEENLYNFALHSRALDAPGYQRFLQVFPSSPRVEELKRLHEENLYNLALRSRLGDDLHYRRFLESFPSSPRVEEVRKLYEENLYEYARNNSTGEPSACTPYLQAFPAGRFFDEIRGLWEDREFTRVRTTARRTGDPTPLRKYLADANNQRHREAASQEISELYDKLIEKLRTQAAGDKAADPKLLTVMTGLLELLKQADSPIVTVGFKATHEDQPKGELESIERLVYQDYLSKDEGLRKVEEEQGNAILPRGDVFASGQSQRRAKLALDRLSAAVGDTINPGILQLRAAAAGKKPMLQVGYHATPTGSLYAYTQTEESTRGGLGEQKTTRVVGLLRGYEVHWKIVARATNSDQIFEYQVTSSPAKSMRYRPSSSDPAWAPYAILIYSSFYDMTNQLILSLGKDPGPVPEAYSFSEATGIDPFERSQLQLPDDVGDLFPRAGEGVYFPDPTPTPRPGNPFANSQLGTPSQSLGTPSESLGGPSGGQSIHRPRRRR